jgi:hypothetical protein
MWKELSLSLDSATEFVGTELEKLHSFFGSEDFIHVHFENGSRAELHSCKINYKKETLSITISAAWKRFSVVGKEILII